MPPQTDPSTATVARDQLLHAIERSAVLVAEDQPGNAPAALVELARAFALVTTGSVRVAVAYTSLSDDQLPEEILETTAYDHFNPAIAYEEWAAALPAILAAAPARLLSAIGRSAELVAEDQTGNAPAALLELARAYALVTLGNRALRRHNGTVVAITDAGDAGW